ncbi:MAG TPA: phosphate ABC transporter substrate-binding protein PstS family protein, partial [Spirochaetia bacterium]|nr:phosphate ABC transporter substrate-binding protein PstS family protein [Spirochaetia bacterium]
LMSLVAVGLVMAGAQAEAAASQEDGLAWIVEPGEDPILPGVNPILVEGDVVAAGSSTVFPLAEEVIARWYDEGYSASASTVYTSVGTGAGFERFASGDSDISGASRPIKDSERDAAAANGVEAEEFIVAFDALAVVVHPSNTWATELTIAELNTAFSTATTWADVRDGFPEVAITRYSPGTDSGTFDYFVEAVFDEDEEPILTADRIQFSEDDNVLVQGVEGDEGAIGYFGFAYYVEESDRLTAVNVESVTPSAATVADGTYPLARPIFIYSDAEYMRTKPQVAAFINFFLTVSSEEARDVGYFPAPTERLNAAKQRWVEIMDGLY